MEERINNLLSSCSEIDFGNVNLSRQEKEFRSELNNEVILLCKSLPESTQTDALLLLLRHLRIPFTQEFNFFRYYYVPTWSIIYWLFQSAPDGKGLEEVDIKNAKSAHSMAIFLHSFDDHLNDNELPISHLALLLRSQAWMMMHNALNSLAEGVSEGKQIVDRFINDYYYGINRLQDVESLDGYCDLFRKQMATGLIAPVLITQKMGNDEEFSDVVQNAFGSFGIAWRLLDDIKDIETDMMKGNHSSIYVCLPEEIKRWWDKDTGEKIDKNSGFAEAILDSVAENDVIKRIKERICSELESAAFIADDCHITGLANEFRCLLTPLKNGRDYV